MQNGERSFTVDALYKGKTKLRMCSCGGRYISNTPSEAAKKAYSQYYRGKSKKLTLIVHIRETTNGSDKKIFKYKISKKSNDSKVERDGKIINYTYETTVKAL